MWSTLEGSLELSRKWVFTWAKWGEIHWRNPSGNSGNTTGNSIGWGFVPYFLLVTISHCNPLKVSKSMQLRLSYLFVSYENWFKPALPKYNFLCKPAWPPCYLAPRVLCHWSAPPVQCRVIGDESGLISYRLAEASLMQERGRFKRTSAIW